jgi:hypothetical protein
MRNPPYALWIALPLGFVGRDTGVVLWSLAIVASLMVSVRILWILNGRPADRLHLLGYIFAPAIACIPLGQTGTFPLMGLVLFLWLHRTRPVIAGACLTLVALKPHLFLVFGLVLLAWSVVRRAYRVVAGSILGMTAALALPFCFRGSIWHDYWPILHAADAESKLLPTVSALVRLASGGVAWAQYIPLGLAALWALRYFYERRESWDWQTDGLLVTLVSVWAAPYYWFTDEVIVLPAILRGIYRNADRRAVMVSFGVANAIALVAVLMEVKLGSGFFIWTSTFWALWYVLSPGTVRRCHR